MRVILEPVDTAGQEKLAEALQECSVAQPTKGLYIVNGKKVVIK